MTTHNPPRPNLVPTSSHAGDDLPKVTSSLVPHPSGGRGHSEAVDDTTTHTPPPRPRDEVIPARPTIYAGIPMRSRLEAAYARFLDNQPDVTPEDWTYEPRCFADATGQYLPDFWCNTTRGDAYVEIKPEPILKSRDELEAALRRMEIIWSSEPGATLALVVGHTVDGFTEPKFHTRLIAHGNDDRLWRIRAYDLRIPMVWDRS